MSENTRYMLIRDDDFQWYVIPVDRESDWISWRDGEGPDETPEYGRKIAQPTSITFSDYEII